MKKTLALLTALVCLYINVTGQAEVRDAVASYRGNGQESIAADAEIFQATIRNGANANQFLVYIRPNVSVPPGSILAAGAPQISFSVLSSTAVFTPVYALGGNTLNNSIEEAGGRRRMTVNPSGNTPVTLPWAANEERLAYTINITGDDTVGARIENDINAGVYIFYVADEPTASNWTHYTTPFYASAPGTARVGVDGIYQYVTIPGTASTLPVTFSAFAVTCNEKGALITWATASEQNSSHFEIEKNVSGSWEKIDQLSAAGNSTRDKSYQYLDLTGGVAQYRLKQVDLDGRSVYTATRSVSCQGPKTNIALYPVPARNNMTLAIQTDRVVRTSLQVFDMAGKLVKQQAAVLNNGSNNIQVDVSMLASGEYMLMSSDKTLQLTRKFTIVR